MKKVISTGLGPKPIGPYSQAIRTNEYVFVSGQVHFNPATGELVQGDIGTLTRRVLENVSAILKEAGLGLESVIKTTVFLADMDDFARMNEAYEEFFNGAPPARSVIEVARLPRDARVEIEAIATCSAS
jgi:2-iminobutanoate/2-iminopropanoate deaminase